MFKTIIPLIISVMGALIGAAYAAVTTPLFALAGGASLGFVAMVGAGTFAGGFVGMIAGAVCGGAALMMTALPGVSAMLSRLKLCPPRETLEVLLVGAVGSWFGAIGGAGYGVYKGYDLTHETLTKQICTAPFNDAAAQECKKNGLQIEIAPKGAAPSASPAR